jgi:ABC-type transporter Mla subunit MlaD
MADTGFGRTDPFSDVIALVAGPIAAGIRSFEQLRKGADELMRGLENFNATMENLNETAARVNRLLNDFEEPVRAMLPQLTRTVKMADDLSLRLATPIDQVIPGLTRLADTLNSPALRSMPTDLGQFMEVINDLSKRMSPLAQIAEQAGSMFGLRIPGLSRQAAPSGASPAPVVATAVSSHAATPSAAAAREAVKEVWEGTAPAPARKRAARQAPAKKAATKKRAAAKRSA